jgi:hypothetical protein
MAPGEYNGKNYGGLHTGTGKYQRGGVYSVNGMRFPRVPSRDFKENLVVRYVGKHKDFMGKRGHIITGGVRRARSIIRVQLSDKIAYFNKKNLEIISSSSQ